MALSRVVRDARLGTSVVVSSLDELKPADAQALYRDKAFLVVDDVPWPEPLGTLRRFREDRVRMFDDPFATHDGMDEFLEAQAPFLAALGGLFESLYGASFRPAEVRKSWRPAISICEPMHFDTWRRDGHVVITSYLNVSDVAREYGVSWTWGDIVSRYGVELEATAGRNAKPENISVMLRAKAQKGEGPLGQAAWRHLVSVSPGSVAIFDAQSVSHELRYGDTALCYSWICQE